MPLTEDERKLLWKIRDDMYYGNGKPGMTTRMETVENSVSVLKDTNKMQNRLLWAILVILLGVLGTAVANLSTREQERPKTALHSFTE